jgi:hypothetical protein
MLQNIKQPSMSKSDLIGISSSILCLLHCLALPLILSMGYLFNHSVSGHWHSLDYLFILMGTVAAWVSARRTSLPALKLAFWIAIFIFSLSILLHDLWSGMIYLSIATSFVLIGLHIYHWKSHQKYHK